MLLAASRCRTTALPEPASREISVGRAGCLGTEPVDRRVALACAFAQSQRRRSAESAPAERRSHSRRAIVPTCPDPAMPTATEECSVARRSGERFASDAIVGRASPVCAASSRCCVSSKPAAMTSRPAKEPRGFRSGRNGAASRCRRLGTPRGSRSWRCRSPRSAIRAFTCRQRRRVAAGSLASRLRCPSGERDFPGGGSTAFPRPRMAASTPELSGAAAFIRDEVAEEPQERNQVVADKTQADDD